MSGKLSKNKGANYERVMAKYFSKWSGKDFYRTPGSGSWSSQRMAQDNQSGDIVAPSDIKFPFSVELKHHEGFTLDSFVRNTGEIPSFYTQNVGDATRSEKVPMLVVHKNYSPNYVSIPYSKSIESSMKENHLPYMVTTVVFKDYLTDTDIYMDVLVMVLEDLFSIYTLEDFIKNHKRMFSYWYKTMLPNLQERRTGNKNTDKELEKIIENLG